MERNSLRTIEIGEIPYSAERYFGSCTPAAALGTCFPSRDSYGYLCQCKHAPRTTTDAPDSEILMRNPG